MKTKIKFHVVLEGQGGELAREVCEFEATEGDDVDAIIDEKASSVIEGFVLSIGDTIRIEDATEEG